MEGKEIVFIIKYTNQIKYRRSLHIEFDKFADRPINPLAATTPHHTYVPTLQFGMIAYVVERIYSSLPPSSLSPSRVYVCLEFVMLFAFHRSIVDHPDPTFEFDLRRSIDVDQS